MIHDDQRSDPSLRYVRALRAVKRDLAESNRAGEAAQTHPPAFNIEAAVTDISDGRYVPQCGENSKAVRILWVVGAVTVFYVGVKLILSWTM